MKRGTDSYFISGITNPKHTLGNTVDATLNTIVTMTHKMSHRLFFA